ncbi:hypothetical protein ABZW10_02280 [Kitasatospora sp. NPDC004723]|uniref:hypothetical protein n=1 Tax=Kitasatospora sp. NPDC004723 TaxID=3154288 RepID=UPI0033A3CD5D
MTTTPIATRPPRWKDLLFAVILLPLFLALPFAVLQVTSAFVWSVAPHFSAARSTALLVVAGLLVLASAGLVARFSWRAGYPVVAVAAVLSPFVCPAVLLVAFSQV